MATRAAAVGYCTSPTPLAKLLSSFAARRKIWKGNGSPVRSTYKALITPDWMQGRTTYGGLSAALCLEGARRTLSDEGSLDLPPLRSALLNFVDAAGGAVEIDASIVRCGKAMSTVTSSVFSEGKEGRACATSGTFVFGAPRLQSKVEATRLMTPPPATLPPPAECESIFAGRFEPPGPTVLFPPTFTQHTTSLLASGPGLATAASSGDLYVWVRWKGADAGGGVGEDVSPDVSLLALADVIPPASYALFDSVAPVSSMTWQINFLDPQPVSFEGGYWLIRTRAEHARHGYSSQNMELWGAGGIAAVSRQSVAIYA